MAQAAAPITQAEVENVGARAARFFRPKPPKVLRPRLDRDFAVLLMRSSYNILDQLDCVPMDQFQRDFFILRQAEYAPYVNALGPGMVQQGDLTDPYYFDFISFAQYLAINREISQDPPMLFEENQPVEVGDNEPQRFVKKIVKRDPSIVNSMLAGEHGRCVAAAILNSFNEVLGDTPSALPIFEAGSLPSVDEMLAAFSQLVKLFLINGFAWDGGVELMSSPSTQGFEFRLFLVSPATLWGTQSLIQQHSPLLNDYLRKAATGLIARTGYKVTASRVKYDGNKEVTYLKLR